MVLGLALGPLPSFDQFYPTFAFAPAFCHNFTVVYLYNLPQSHQIFLHFVQNLSQLQRKIFICTFSYDLG